jgi:hypothetical protein
MAGSCFEDPRPQTQRVTYSSQKLLDSVAENWYEDLELRRFDPTVQWYTEKRVYLTGRDRKQHPTLWSLPTGNVEVRN